MKKKAKIILIIIIAMVFIVLALTIVRFVISSKNSSASTTYTVIQETYRNTISIAGVVSAAQEQTLQALSDGTVVAVYVEKGDSVKKGDVIIQLDDTTQQYNLAKHDYDMETKKITGSQKELALMETERLSLVQKIEERKVSATFDGIIADLDVAVGDSLEAKDSVGNLVDVSYLVADVEVAETDVAKLKEGQNVEFKFPAYNGTVYGYVVSWPAIGEVTSRGATIVKVRVRIDEYPKSILPNFSFSGNIQISPDETYTLVERYAIGRENAQAYVVKAKTNEKIYVKVEPYTGGFVKILEGDLIEGDVLSQQTVPKASGYNRRPGGSSGPGGPPPGAR